MTFYYFAGALLGALVGTKISFPLFTIVTPIIVYYLTKRPKIALIVLFFLGANYLSNVTVDLKDVEFVGKVVSTQTKSSVLKGKVFIDGRWEKLPRKVLIWKEEPVGAIVYAKGYIYKQNGYPQLVIKPTFYATSTDFNIMYEIYSISENYRKELSKYDKTLVSLFGGREREDVFKESGLYHIFCVSGMHVSILFGLSYYLTGLLVYKKRIRLLISLIFPTAFVIASGISIVSVRALLMIYAATMFKMLDIKVHPINSLSFVGLVLLLNEPSLFFSASFYMSFFSTLGVLSATHKYTAGIGGFLGSAPFISTFSSVNLFSPLGTFLVSPFVSISLYLSVIGFSFYVLNLNFLTDFVLRFANFFAFLINKVAQLIAPLPKLPSNVYSFCILVVAFFIFLAHEGQTP